MSVIQKGQILNRTLSRFVEQKVPVEIILANQTIEKHFWKIIIVNGEYFFDDDGFFYPANHFTIKSVNQIPCRL